jgi:RNA polymerase sigma-70 factor (ECF subfamily)
MTFSAAAVPVSGSQAILVEHYDRVHRYLQRRLRHLSGDADDLAQEVCVRFLGSYRGQPLDSPVAYLLTIAAHALADFRQRAKREREFMTIDTEALSDWPNPEADGSSPVERCMAAVDLPQFLQQLPHTQRAVLVAHMLQGYSYVEVAQRLGLTELTVEKYLTLARAQLRSSRLAHEAKWAGRP